MEIELKFKEDEITKENSKIIDRFNNGDINFGEMLGKLNVEMYKISVVKYILTIFK